MDKLVHDINADISSLVNALEIIDNKLDLQEDQLIKKMLFLSLEKSKKLADNWADLKVKAQLINGDNNDT